MKQLYSVTINFYSGQECNYSKQFFLTKEKIVKIEEAFISDKDTSISIMEVIENSDDDISSFIERFSELIP